MKKEFILCDCESEILFCSRYPDEDCNYLAIYSYGLIREKPTLWDRLKYCWYHLRTGKKYEDMVILNRENAEKLANWLLMK